MQVSFVLKYYSDLSLDELYAIMVLRQQVFVVEQNCPFLDCDGLDRQCWHLMCYSGDSLVAYCRLLPAHLSYVGYTSIGRVVSTMESRRHGLGITLMEEALKEQEKLFGDLPIKIGAQLYLKRFYEIFGFQVSGEIYLEDGIEHIHMIRPARSV